jgi:acyl-CoA thioester hydrolase
MSRLPPGRGDYRHFERFTTRWRDNDVYGHLNNAVFYEYVDTLVNGWLISSGALPVPRGPIVCLVAETGCTFFASVAFPAAMEAGLRLDRLGTTSITYGIGLFSQDDATAAAVARFVHVCVDRDTHRPTPVPDRLREALATLAS